MKFYTLNIPINEDTAGWMLYESEEEPIPGELCKVKVLVDIKAYYVPDNKLSDWLIPDQIEDIGEIVKSKLIAWKPIRGEKNFHDLNK